MLVTLKPWGKIYPLQKKTTNLVQKCFSEFENRFILCDRVPPELADSYFHRFHGDHHHCCHQSTCTTWQQQRRAAPPWPSASAPPSGPPPPPWTTEPSWGQKPYQEKRLIFVTAIIIISKRKSDPSFQKIYFGIPMHTHAKLHSMQYTHVWLHNCIIA